MEIKNNIKDTALIFEGGGMRASYTAGILNNLLENKLYFNYIAGISAGSSHTVNYVSRDKERAKKSFVDFVKDPNFGGWKSF
ncbi:MAG TPA: patatin family protein, partial [Clostridiales bacterium]|nr:patatin family protein [Clostridiales bacterium]